MNNENVTNLIKALGDYNVATAELFKTIFQAPLDIKVKLQIELALSHQIKSVIRMMEEVCGTTLDKH